MEASNVKAMREALVMLKRLFDGRLMWQSDIRKAHEAVNAALAAPPRNCDVGTADEQRDRLEAFCGKHFRYSADNPCSGCQAYNGDSSPCVYRFLQMPYDETK